MSKSPEIDHPRTAQVPARSGQALPGAMVPRPAPARDPRLLTQDLAPRPKHARLASALAWITVVVFVAALVAPLLDPFLRPDAVREPVAENRAARPSPSFPETLAELSTFPAAIDAHHADTFGLRDVLLHWNSVLKTNLFGVSPASVVVLGPGRWADYAGEKTFEVLRGLDPLRRAGLDEWLGYFALCRSFCERRNARYLYVMCPNKETVYHDHVPARFEHLGPTRADQIAASLPETLRESYLDLRPAMRTAREQDEPPANHLYFVGGSHWNGRGAWTAYQAMMRAIAPWFPAAHALTEADITWGVQTDSDVDSWGPRLYQPDSFKDTLFMCLPKQVTWQDVDTGGVQGRWHGRNPSATGPRVLVLCDSFGPSLYALLAATFPEIVLVQGAFDPALVLGSKPDLVVDVRVERYFVVSPILAGAGRSAMESAAAPVVDATRIAVDASGPEQLTPDGAARAARVGGGIELAAQDSRAGWILEPFEVTAIERAWLSLEIESDTSGTLVVYRREGGAWLRREAVRLAYAAGRHAYTLALPGPAGTRQIRLQLFEAPARIVVRGLAVRTSGV